jgi:hypothetical protein
MTPKDKANDLFHKFYLVNSESLELETGEYDLVLSLDARDAKQCALIAVDEILEAIKTQPYGLHYLSEAGYWGEVKKLIENL